MGRYGFCEGQSTMNIGEIVIWESINEYGKLKQPWVFVAK
jgi:hypothetical protein